MKTLSQPDFRTMAAEVLFFKAFRQYISVTMPIRLIKLPQEEFIDRYGVLSYLKGKLEASNDHQHLLSLIASKMDAVEVTKVPDHKYADEIAEKFIEDSSIIQDFFRHHTRFAILSHTWITLATDETEVSHPDKREITFHNTRTIVKENAKIRIVSSEAQGPGFDKFKKFCRAAYTLYDVEFAWMDTICIDKPAETNESIGSMFKWYFNSSICIVYLASTTSTKDVASDPWFTRGWTLQELLVPKKVAFFSWNWELIGSYDKEADIRHMKEQEMSNIIHNVTTIHAEELYGFRPGLIQGIPSRMIWIKNRKTSHEEDIAYSLMGVFGVVFPVDYSEGREKAFFRLLEAIIQKSINLNTLSIFNYAGRSVSNNIHGTNILPSEPNCYSSRHVSLNDFVHYVPLKPLKLGPNGLKVNLVLVFAVLDKSFSENIADDTPPMFTCLQNKMAKIWADERVVVHLLHNTPRDRAKLSSHNCFVFGIWNFEDKEDKIILPDICPAFLLQLNAPPKVSIDLIESSNFSPASKVDTMTVIILKKHKGRPVNLELMKKDLKLFTLSYVECRL
ncbi:hypothetical protein HYPSUDRAFT_535655 [Hypholoma sublateritium FD-334 SS-4]|uniref:Heterokaryon incompatibility domain-containing protein n=1 Tax=Hypholoma sublateritium (strain FD-334 SS-4) TaxID=945553 RepID=A0A0D2PXN8_HYPSF|nr:hypothetical protein HYPSUDRAFT_535655 [Hypholoma sublateritium FD-334 SS-4]